MYVDFVDIMSRENAWQRCQNKLEAQLALGEKRLVNLLVYLYKQCRPG